MHKKTLTLKEEKKIGDKFDVIKIKKNSDRKVIKFLISSHTVIKNRRFCLIPAEGYSLFPIFLMFFSIHENKIQVEE